MEYMKTAPSKTSKINQLERKPGYILIMITVVALLVAGITYFATQKGLFGQPKPVTPEEDVKITVAAVGKLMMLPADEVPTVASVADITQLTNQPFFTRAQNGDKVLIYNNKKQAILYRPSTNMIIEVAPINVTATNPAEATASGQTGTGNKPATPTPVPVTFTLYNGTQVSGLTKTYESALKKIVPGAIILNRGNTRGDYDKTILVDVKGNKNDIAVKLAKDLGISWNEMPSGESTPSSDFLIIIGQDRAQ
jgi:hypothetical protein